MTPQPPPGRPRADRLAPGPVSQLLPLLDAAVFSPEVYRKAGVFVLRRALAPDLVARWHEAWQRHQQSVPAEGRQVNAFNPVVVNEALEPPLSQVYRCDAILELVGQLYPDLALYTWRYLVKDAHSRAPVFLHQDFGYNRGWPEKTSVFVPLTPMCPENGGLVLYPGTHALGYLGDAGEVNAGVLDPAWPTVCPSLEPGDVVLMHDCTWHASRPHVAGPDRVLAQLTYQPATDPSSAELLRGQWGTDHRLAPLPDAHLFTRSRSSRLRELQAAVDRQAPSPAGADRTPSE